MNVTVDSTRRRDGAARGDDHPAPAPDAREASAGERRAAQARYDAFASDGGNDAASRDVGSDGGPSETCAPDPPPNPVLFLKEAQDTNAIDIHDVTQASPPDCAFMAALGALTRTSEGRSLLRNAVVENRNSDGSVASYTVTRCARSLSGGIHSPRRHSPSSKSR